MVGTHIAIVLIIMNANDATRAAGPKAVLRQAEQIAAKAADRKADIAAIKAVLAGRVEAYLAA
jgi:hypothetical protein